MENNSLIGWVYEQNHEKEKSALRDLDDWHLQDRINDINDTKQAELDAIQELIDKWELYLKALNWSHNQFDRDQRDKLIQEMMGVGSMAEAENQIITDWKNFNDTCEGEYKDYNGRFTDFLSEYKSNMEELDRLAKLPHEILDPSKYLHSNDKGLNPDISPSDDIANSLNLSDEERDIIKLAQEGWKQARASGNEELAKLWHNYVETIRMEHGYYGSDDGSDRIWLTDEERAERNALTTHNGKTMTVNQAEMESYKEQLAAYFSDADTISKEYYAKAWNNVLKHQETVIEEANINQSSLANWLAYNRNAEAQYDLLNMNFADFIAKYSAQIDEYEEEINRFKKANGIASFYDAAEIYSNISLGEQGLMVMSSDNTWMTKEDAELLDSYKASWKKSKNKDEKDELNRLANELRMKYGYFGGADGSERDIRDQALWEATQNGVPSNDYLSNESRNLIRLAKKEYAKAKESGLDELAQLWHEIAQDARNESGITADASGADFRLLTDDEIAALEKETVYEGKLMTQREADYQRHLSEIIKKMASLNENYKDYNANEWKNILKYKENAITEKGLNTEIVSNWIDYNTNSEAQFDLQIMNFETFIDKYSDKIKEYSNKINEFKSLNEDATTDDAVNNIGKFDSGTVDGYEYDYSSHYNNNSSNSSSGSSNTNNNANKGTSSKQTYVQSVDGTLMTPEDAKKLKDLQDNWKSYPPGEAHRLAEEIRRKYFYTTDAEGRNVDYRSVDYDSYVRTQTAMYEQWRKENGYAKGLENGPVSYTGLAMLHGTPSAPEYVLNSDQAYNLLYNLSRNRAPEYTSNIQSEGTKYILNGDIIIDGASDPKAFWDEVTRSMGNRAIVSKNR